MDGSRPYLVDVRDPRRFVSAALELFPDGGHISLEGDLALLDRRDLSGLSTETTPILKPNTLEPHQDFTVVPITPATRKALIESALHRVGLRKRVIHVQIESAGRLVLSACDNFHPECTWIAVELTFLTDWTEKQIICGFRLAPGQ